MRDPSERLPIEFPEAPDEEAALPPP